MNYYSCLKFTSPVHKIPIETFLSFSSELFFTIMQQIKCRNSKNPSRNNRMFVKRDTTFYGNTAKKCSFIIKKYMNLRVFV